MMNLIQDFEICFKLKSFRLQFLKRGIEFVSKLEGSGVKASILNESKIVRLCNLINNPAYVNLDGTSFDVEMPILKEKL